MQCFDLFVYLMTGCCKTCSANCSIFWNISLLSVKAITKLNATIWISACLVACLGMICTFSSNNWCWMAISLGFMLMVIWGSSPAYLPVRFQCSLVLSLHFLRRHYADVQENFGAVWESQGGIFLLPTMILPRAVGVWDEFIWNLCLRSWILVWLSRAVLSWSYDLLVSVNH